MEKKVLDRLVIATIIILISIGVFLTLEVIKIGQERDEAIDNFMTCYELYEGYSNFSDCQDECTFYVAREEGNNKELYYDCYWNCKKEMKI